MKINDYIISEYSRRIDEIEKEQDCDWIDAFHYLVKNSDTEHPIIVNRAEERMKNDNR